jgi:O-acetyl-ADP-ribose deacetylase (regulator of RNase III)
MIKNIAEAPLAIVDISTLNPNVFYEMGVRHALRPSGTVLIRHKGTESPFNIEGFNCIDYDIGSGEDRHLFMRRLQEFLENARSRPEHRDSLVYDVLPDLRVERGPPATASRPQVLRDTRSYCHRLKSQPDKQICLITGDWRDISICDIWVNSENTNMQMARFYERSVSGLIRYLGARKSLTGEIVEDTVASALAEALAGAERVEKATVIPTGPGRLAETNKVKALFHVGSVEGELGVGYKPISNIERCVRNALAMADSDRFRDQQLHSILFPIMGAGTAGGELSVLTRHQIGAALDYLELNPGSCINSVYFSAFTDRMLETLTGVIDALPTLERAKK